MNKIYIALILGILVVGIAGALTYDKYKDKDFKIKVKELDSRMSCEKIKTTEETLKEKYKDNDCSKYKPIKIPTELEGFITQNEGEVYKVEWESYK